MHFYIKPKLAPLYAFIFLGLASCADNDTTTKGKSMADINKKAVIEAVPEKSPLNSIKPKSSIAFDSDIVWSENFAGSFYQSIDGLILQGDDKTSYDTNSVKQGQINHILGTQDNFPYLSYIEGDIQLNKAVDNGIYDIIFKFVEPADIPAGKRIFNVFVQEQLAINELDVRQARDGNHLSALDRAITDVVVDNGELVIHLTPTDTSEFLPVLSAIVVRKKHQKNKAWQLVWHDEFDYTGEPDPSKWSFDLWPARKVNDEDQTYTNNPKNVRVEDGKLLIIAHKEDVDGAEYSSGRIHSAGKGDFLYGRAEVRAKLPAGQGTWSAIWMLPSDPYRYSTTCQPNEDWQGSASCDAWPNSGEIDIMEHVGFDMHNVHGTVHNKAYYWANWEQRKGSIEAKNIDTAFHTYSVEWSPENITVFFDDTPYFSYSNEHTNWQAWPYDHPYHIILNLAIGGMWGRAGGPIDDSIFPVQMEIDYVRVYSLKENNK